MSNRRETRKRASGKGDCKRIRRRRRHVVTHSTNRRCVVLVYTQLTTSSSSLGTNRSRETAKTGECKSAKARRRKRERETRANRCVSRQTFQYLFLFAPPESMCDSHTALFLLLHHLSALRRQLFNSAHSPTNDARSIYDPVNSFYSTVKSA